MDQFTPAHFSTYRVFSEAEWSGLRADAAMTLSEDEVRELRSFNDVVLMSQVERIYVPLARLLAMYAEAMQQLHTATTRFLGGNGEDDKVPFVIGIAGSVAVGKSTTARLLKALIARWPSTPKVDLVPTDGFLYPNAVLEAEGLMERKGFPESYDVGALLQFLMDVKAGKGDVRAPVYSHLTYDIIPGALITVDRPDILIVEGLNVLQTSRQKSERRNLPFVSDFFDFSIYVDADEKVLERWYLERFLRMSETRFRDPKSYFRKYASLTKEDALDFAEGLWQRVNLVNLRDNIAPTKPRADLILYKGANHNIEQVALRKV